MHNVIKSCIDKKKSIESKRRTKVIVVTEYEKFIDMTLDSTLQLTFKKLLLDNFYSLFTFYPIFVIIAIICLIAIFLVGYLRKDDDEYDDY